MLIVALLSLPFLIGLALIAIASARRRHRRLKNRADRQARHRREERDWWVHRWLRRGDGVKRLTDQRAK